MRRLIHILAAILIALALVLGFRHELRAYDGCRPEPITPFTPTGIAGCEVWGEGIASHYGPGYGVAMNFCTWELRHEVGCGSVQITAKATGITVVAPVVDFGDLYTGTPDERIVDLQYGVVAALGLDQGRGLYEVTVWPGRGVPASVLPIGSGASLTLPDTAGCGPALVHGTGTDASACPTGRFERTALHGSYSWGRSHPA